MCILKEENMIRFCQRLLDTFTDKQSRYSIWGIWYNYHKAYNIPLIWGSVYEENIYAS